MKKAICLMVVCGLMAGCAAVPPVQQTIKNSFPVDKPFPQVWQAVIEVFSELNLPIMNMEKASGLITTDWISFNGQKDETGYCACGKPAFPMGETGRHGRFNVYVKQTTENSCEMKINAIFEMETAYKTSIQWTSCYSTGKLEAEIYRRVQDKLK